RGRLLPSLTVDSRYSQLDGALNLGDFVNPAYRALNQITGSARFPTDIDVTLPFQYDSRLRLAQPLINPAIWANHSLARHQRDGQQFERGAAARRIAAEAQAAYLRVAAARSGRQTWEATLALVLESERVAQRLVDAGRATPDAVLRARADRAEVEQQLADARETEDAAARAFNQILRRPLDTPVGQLPDSLIRFDLAVSEQQAVAHGLDRREELQQAGAGIRAAEAAVRLATAPFLPSLSVALDYGFQSRELSFSRADDYTAISVVVSWNLFNGGSDLARRQSAQLEADRLRLRRTELEDLIRLEVRQAYESAVVAKQAIGTAEARLAAARRSFELVRRRYEEGMAAQVEFLDARTSYTSAELNRVQTVYQYALRYVELERAAALRKIELG
ncbi:MAG TPA: TolC family protein, partial [Gemmatimonadales bacterium]|nr:TolC family protein [Gemmatimonadales bacterium]